MVGSIYKRILVQAVPGKKPEPISKITREKHARGMVQTKMKTTEKKERSRNITKNTIT
jgi:hypothetical protein